ncbi:phosphotyrosine protein phosphatase [Candidatus Woesearchaeota archaeon]|nr:phosphotyrosine protein phosphatase [Candidatus Woesearchaeota archaeon]
MNVLFICNQNQNRSKTAEELFQGIFTTRSAGLYNEQPVTNAELEWADVIVVMEDSQRGELAKRFPKQYLQKRILSLDIPDIFKHDQPQLVEILKIKVEEALLPSL